MGQNQNSNLCKEGFVRRVQGHRRSPKSARPHKARIPEDAPGRQAAARPARSPARSGQTSGLTPWAPRSTASRKRGPPPTRKIRWAPGYVTHRRRPRLRDRAAAEVKWKPPILLKRGDVFPHTALLPVSCVPLPSASRGGVTNDRATCRPGPSSGGAGQLPCRTRLLMSLPLSPFSEDELLFCSPSPRPSLNPAELRPDGQIRQRTGAVTSPVPVRGAKALRP